MAIITLNNNSLSGVTALPTGVGGKVLQVQSAIDTGYRSTTSASYTKAGNTCDVNITPSSTSSKILITCSFGGGISASANRAWYTFFRDSTDLGTGDGIRTHEVSGSAYTSENSIHVYYLDSPNTTSQITYSIQMKGQNGNTVNFGQKGISTLTCMEVAG